MSRYNNKNKIIIGWAITVYQQFNIQSDKSGPISLNMSSSSLWRHFTSSSLDYYNALLTKLPSCPSKKKIPRRTFHLSGPMMVEQATYSNSAHSAASLPILLNTELLHNFICTKNFVSLPIWYIRLMKQNVFSPNLLWIKMYILKEGLKVITYDIVYSRLSWPMSCDRQV